MGRNQDFYHDVPSWSQKRDFIRVNLPRSGEFSELLEALLAQLREIAGALERVNLPSTEASDEYATGSAL